VKNGTIRRDGHKEPWEGWGGLGKGKSGGGGDGERWGVGFPWLGGSGKDLLGEDSLDPFEVKEKRSVDQKNYHTYTYPHLKRSRSVEKRLPMERASRERGR